MFGYVRPFKPEMKVREFESYQAVYCGLCKQLGRSFGLLSRFTLNYDFTFLALLSIAVSPEECHPSYCRERCIAHPLRKRPCCSLSVGRNWFDFSAGAAVLMVYYKLLDNLSDSPWYRKLLYYPLLPLARRIRKKACRDYQEIDQVMAQMMERQAQLEGSGCDVTDEAAQPTGEALAELFAMLSPEESQSRVLRVLGYQMGRWIYFMDALDDIHEDVKNNGYNPFIQKAKRLLAPEKSLSSAGSDEIPQEILLDAVGILNMTAAQIQSAYQLLQLRHLQPILDNIIDLGLRESMRVVLAKHNQQHLLEKVWESD